MRQFYNTITRSWSTLVSTLIDEVRRKHAGSVFGMGWFLIMPLLFLFFYAMVYLVIFKVKPADMSPVNYLHFIYIGLMTYLGFAEAITVGAGSLVTNRAIILNTVFPVELLPLRTVLVTQATFIIGISLAVVWGIVAGHSSFWLLLVPLLMIQQTIFLIGLGWLLAPIFIVFRDLGQILSFAVLALLVISPIAYRASDLSGTQVVLLYINPLYYYLASYQAIIFDGHAPPLVPFLLGSVSCVVMFVVGLAFFTKVKSAIAEYV